MASISRQPNGRRTIQFTDGERVRRSIRLGKVSQKQAELVKTRIEIILASKTSGHPLDVETARWVSSLDDVLHERLANTGLFPSERRSRRRRRRWGSSWNATCTCGPT